MIAALPRCGLVGFGSNFGPFLGFPVEEIQGIEPFFVESAASEQDDLSMNLIVVYGAVGPRRGYLTGSLMFGPGHGAGVERPDVVHIIGV